MVSSYKKSSAEWFIEQLNVENAKLVAFLLVLGFIGYHGILHLRYGPDSCTWLLSSGRYKGDHEWQPYGCMLHRYSKTDARRCLRYLAFWGKYNSFAFIGDSKLEQLYEYFIGVLKTRLDLDTSYSTVNHHQPNYTYVDNKLRLSVSFIWSEDVSKTMVEQFRTWQHLDQPPSLIVASTGLELLRTRNTTDTILDEYKRNLTRLVQAVDSLASKKTQVLWKLIEPIDQTQLQDGPKKITNNDIDAYNRAAIEILTYSSAHIWSAPRLIWAGSGNSEPRALRHYAQSLLNMFCNDHMNYNDGTCCAQPEPNTGITTITFAVFLICFVIQICQMTWRCATSIHNHVTGYTPLQLPPPPKKSPLSPLSALSRLGLILAYFYLCDRTNFFMKENKYYSEWSFWLPVGYVFALGLFFTDDSRSSRVMHREQTDEWKGWMQLVILVYQVTGASKVTSIYMLVRALVSSYLFLTGFGHFYYLWKTGEVRFSRWLRVMFRLNFLTVMLCLTMNRPYQFYSFIPLVSFWYTMMFLALALPPRVFPSTSNESGYIFASTGLKVLGLVGVVTVLYMSEVFFQKIFVTRPWKALFVNSDDDIHQWWLMWKQDRYSVAYGMVFGLAQLAAQRYGLIEDSSKTNLFSSGMSVWCTVVALGGVASYVTFTLLCTNTVDCNEIHSYAAFVPILAYILLRNVSGVLRTRHSTMFAWFGKITLELFASQSHIWLAADTHGVLVLVPSSPVLNLMLTSYIFVCAAHELHKLTAVVLPYAVPDDCKLLLRNVAIFLTCLIAIGIHDGMF